MTRARCVMGILACMSGLVPAALADTGFELWSDCTSLPDFSQVAFLPIFTADETPGFVDLAPLTVEHAGESWKALQFTRDKSFEVTVPQDTWLFGLLGDEWPAGAVDAFKELHAARLEAIVVDGSEIKVTPACILAAPDRSFAVYATLIRFPEPGTHTIEYMWRQRRAFFFVFPFGVFGMEDPAGLDGRRVFLPGETVGTLFDGHMVLRYEVTVQ